MSAYQALYRKYRPQTFDDVVGQTAVTQTLKTQIVSGKLSHAYLFTGCRGTGKTSCAKILAKAVNCLEPENGNPCNRCKACRSIDDGTCMDVLEIDAASNNGVDNVRDLRDDAVYSPSQVKKRVYIVDEVHMLSTSAFKEGTPNSGVPRKTMRMLIPPLPGRFHDPSYLRIQCRPDDQFHGKAPGQAALLRLLHTLPYLR